MVWLWSPSRSATMHRRLRDACTRIDVTALSRQPSAAATDVHEELRLQATELDRHVVHASGLPRRHRRVALRTIDQQVVQLDVLSRRLVAMAQAPDSTRLLTNPSPAEALADIAQRLDMIEEAQAEIAHLERSSGLFDLDQLGAQLDAEAAARTARTAGPPPPAPPVSPVGTERPGPTRPAPAPASQPPPPPPHARPVALPPPSTHDRIPPVPRTHPASVPVSRSHPSPTSPPPRR
jgi:hypothetical protein